MGDAQDMYEHAMRKTGIDDPAEALESLINSYGREDEYTYEDEDYIDDEMQYDVGDTVRLQSGGPLMTVKEVNEKIYVCRWFDKDHNLNSSEFHKDEIYYDSDHQEADNANPQNTFVQETSVPKIDINEDEIPF